MMRQFRIMCRIAGFSGQKVQENFKYSFFQPSKNCELSMKSENDDIASETSTYSSLSVSTVIVSIQVMLLSLSALIAD